MDTCKLEKNKDTRNKGTFCTLHCFLCIPYLKQSLMYNLPTGHSENNDATNRRGGTEKQNEMVNSQESCFVFPYALLLNKKNLPRIYDIIWAVSKGSIIAILFFSLTFSKPVVSSSISLGRRMSMLICLLRHGSSRMATFKSFT